jgi:intracellular septation protein
LKGLWFAGRELALDFASTLFFLVLFELTKSLTLSVGVAIAVAVAQIGWNLAKGRKIDALQWVSLAIVISSGSATLITGNRVFVMLKPTVIYLAVAWAMLQRGWMTRFMPPRALQYVPDMVISFGYVWAGMMVFSALLNLGLALTGNIALWGSVMSAWALFSKLGLFAVQYAIMNYIGRRRADRRTPGVSSIRLRLRRLPQVARF